MSGVFQALPLLNTNVAIMKEKRARCLFLCEHDVIVVGKGKGVASHPGPFKKSEKIAVVSHVQLKIHDNVHINIMAHGGNSIIWDS